MKKAKLISEIETEKFKNRLLEKEILHLKKMLDAEIKAKENGCHRGQYCANCKHAVLVKIGTEATCYCTYGQCEHFEKEHHVVEA